MALVLIVIIKKYNAERMFAAELLCTSREEHIAFFGDAGDFDDADADDLDFMHNDSDED